MFLRILEGIRHRSMYYSAAGVRDGIIADLANRRVGSELSRLSREQRQMVEAMTKRYGVAIKHARQVASLAHSLFETMQPLHRQPPTAGNYSMPRPTSTTSVTLSATQATTNTQRIWLRTPIFPVSQPKNGSSSRQSALPSQIHAAGGAFEFPGARCRSQANGSLSFAAASCGRCSRSQP